MNEHDIEKITESTNIISDWSYRLLSNLGVGGEWIKYINAIFLLIILAILVFILQYITRKLVQVMMKHMGNISKMQIAQRLQERRFPHFLAMIVPFSLVKGSIPIIFEMFPQAMKVADKLTDIYLIFYVIWLVMSVINAFGDTLKTKPGLSDKPIDSYTQVVRIFFYFIGFIIIISILTGKNPMYFITGLGAASAILLLVFKDTIMGFVASIQVSANDMVRIGDLITMPKNGANGHVTQITLTTVKVRNLDKTIVTIPPYSFISDSFQNWRGINEAGGRQFQRCLYVNQSDVRFMNDEELEGMKKIQGLKDYIEHHQKELDKINANLKSDLSQPLNGFHITNSDLLIQYALWAISHHPRINKKFTIMVRTLDPTPEGLPIQLYGFTSTTDLVEFEKIVGEIINHVLAVLPSFQLRIYTTTASDSYDIYIKDSVKINTGK